MRINDNRYDSVLAALRDGKATPRTDVKTVALTAPVNNSNCDADRPPTVSMPINTLNLQGVQAKVITYNITNTLGVDKDIVMGSVAAEPGAASKWGLTSESAADAAGVIDQFGAAVEKVRRISDWQSRRGMILQSIKVFADGTTPAGVLQYAEEPKMFAINPNGNASVIDGGVVERDERLNWVMLASCDIPMTTNAGVIYTVKAGQTVKIEQRYTAVASIENFTPNAQI